MVTLTMQSPIKSVKINEDTVFAPVSLARYFAHDESQPLQFVAKLANGAPLPEGLVLSKEGVLSGRVKRGLGQSTPYAIKGLVVSGTEKLPFEFQLYIYPIKTAAEIAELHAEAWRSLAELGAIPESLESIINRPISRTEVYYLLQRFASFTIWNADDLRLAEGGRLIEVNGISPDFNVYDFEVCLVAAPKDLFSHERTLGDALQTAKAMAKEAHRRNWHVEFGGFDRMANIAWYEIQELNLKAKHQMQVRNYEPPEIKRMVKQAGMVNQ